MEKYNPIYSVGIEELDLQNYEEVLDFLKKNKIRKIIKKKPKNKLKKN